MLWMCLKMVVIIEKNKTSTKHKDTHWEKKLVTTHEQTGVPFFLTTCHQDLR